MYRRAFELGKIKLSKEIFLELTDYLIIHKYIPKLKKLKEESGKILTKKDQKIFEVIPILEGHVTIVTPEVSERISLHYEKWKHDKESLRNNILIDSVWEIETWKKIYEFIVRYGFDEQIIELLAEKNLKDKKENFQTWNKYFIELFKKKRMRLDLFRADDEQIVEIQKINFDQIALEIMEQKHDDQKKTELIIVKEIGIMSDEEVLENGKEMLVSFTFLGLSDAVEVLSNRMLEIIDEVKDRITILYTMSNSLLVSARYYKSIDLIKDTIMNEPLLKNEKIEFIYLLAENYYLLKDYEKASEYYKQIVNLNKKHRLAHERLEELAKNK